MVDEERTKRCKELQQRLLKSLRSGPKAIDDLTSNEGKTRRIVTGALIQLSTKKLAKKLPDGQWSLMPPKRRPPPPTKRNGNGTSPTHREPMEQLSRLLEATADGRNLTIRIEGLSIEFHQ